MAEEEYGKNETVKIINLGNSGITLKILIMFKNDKS